MCRRAVPSMHCHRNGRCQIRVSLLDWRGLSHSPFPSRHLPPVALCPSLSLSRFPLLGPSSLVLGGIGKGSCPDAVGASGCPAHPHLGRCNAVNSASPADIITRGPPVHPSLRLKQRSSFHTGQPTTITHPPPPPSPHTATTPPHPPPSNAARLVQTHRGKHAAHAVCEKDAGRRSSCTLSPSVSAIFLSCLPIPSLCDLSTCPRSIQSQVGLFFPPHLPTQYIAMPSRPHLDGMATYAPLFLSSFIPARPRASGSQ